MSVTASALRANVYRLLDQAIATGEELEIERNGVVVRIVPPPMTHSWVERLPRRPGVIPGDPEDLVGLASHEWRPDPL